METFSQEALTQEPIWEDPAKNSPNLDLKVTSKLERDSL